MIYTVTLNPSLDYISDVKDFRVGTVNRSGGEHILPGGKGLNVSFMLRELGCETRALGFLAGFTGEEIKRLVAEKGLCEDFLFLKDGFSRINMKIRGGEDTEINGAGPFVSDEERETFLCRLAQTVCEGDTLVLSGSAPRGFSGTAYAEIAERISGKSVRIVADASGQVLWDVRVEGNRAIEERDVLALLETHGVRIGAPLSSIDTGIIEHLVMIDSDRISWISINLVGTVAEVEIREHEEAPEGESYVAANLMASRWGVVDHFEEVRGNIAVKIGDVVSEGDLLVGGLYETEGGGVRCTCARGKVFARTERDFAEEIPLRYEKKEYTGRRKTKKTLIFFEKEIKFFTNAGKTYDNYDIIDTIEYWELPGGIQLPVGVRTVRYEEYAYVDARRTPEEAEALAYERLYSQMEAAVPEGELVRKRLTATLTDEAFVLRCTANYIENIAVVRPIEWEILPKTDGA